MDIEQCVPGSETWEQVWASFKETLAKSKIGCDIEDFMLMHVDGNGDVHFKNSITRNYIVLKPNGTLHIPKDGPFRRGIFASFKDLRL